MLALDGLLLAAVAFAGVQGFRAESRARKVRTGEVSHKRALEEMLREGTLDRYLRELGDAPSSNPGEDSPPARVSSV